MFGNILGTTCLFTLNLVFLAFAAALRLLPSVFRGIRFIFRGVLVLSVRLYSLILYLVAPVMERWFGINMRMGLLRVLFTMGLSLVLGLLIILILGIPVNVWSAGLCILHGLIVGLVWDDGGSPEGFRVGVPIE